MAKAQQFKINDHLEVKFKKGKSMIYVDSKPFKICKYLFLIDPQSKPSQDSIDSIDEAEEILNGDFESESVTPEMVGLSGEQVFWGHCSNLQAWWELDYDTRVLHSNLSFPLLKRLTEVGDAKAKKVFKEEIAKRFLDGYLPVVCFLLEGKYLDYLELEEKSEIIERLHQLLDGGSLLLFETALMVTELCVCYIEKREEDKIGECLSKLKALEDRLKVLKEGFAYKRAFFTPYWARIGYQLFLVDDLREAKFHFKRSIQLNENIRKEKIASGSKSKKNLQDFSTYSNQLIS
ncbi:hypothetical protein ES707_12112 [subsurface metagenome]